MLNNIVLPGSPKLDLPAEKWEHNFLQANLLST
jgi:hypothetical protein